MEATGTEEKTTIQENQSNYNENLGRRDQRHQNRASINFCNPVIGTQRKTKDAGF